MTNIKVKDFTDSYLRAILNHVDEYELMIALGYDKKGDVTNEHCKDLG